MCTCSCSKAVHAVFAWEKRIEEELWLTKGRVMIRLGCFALVYFGSAMYSLLTYYRQFDLKSLSFVDDANFNSTAYYSTGCCRTDTYTYGLTRACTDSKLVFFLFAASRRQIGFYNQIFSWMSFALILYLMFGLLQMKWELSKKRAFQSVFFNLMVSMQTAMTILVLVFVIPETATIDFYLQCGVGQLVHDAQIMDNSIRLLYVTLAINAVQIAEFGFRLILWLVLLAYGGIRYAYDMCRTDKATAHQHWVDLSLPLVWKPVEVMVDIFDTTQI